MRKYLVYLFCLIMACPAGAQVLPTTASERSKGLRNKQALEERSLINDIPLTSIGPYIMGGRVVDLAVNEANPTEFYVAYATGGVWYTRNNGQSYIPITDSLPVSSIGAIAVNWKEGVVWVGTGEANAQRNALAGTGVYKTTNNGKSWMYSGLPESHHIGKVLLHPANGLIAWVAVMGRLHSPNKERGVYKTVDGGKNWKQVLYIDDSTGAVDLALNPRNPKEVWAATWCLLKTKPWAARYYGATSGIYKSLDGGSNWKLLTGKNTGFLQGDKTGRIGIAVFPGNTDTVYSVVDNTDTLVLNNKNYDHKSLVGEEVYASYNGGKNWQKINKEPFSTPMPYGGYFGKISVSPKDSRKIFVGGTFPMVSTDGGGKFTQIRTINHADQHAIWINPKNDHHVIVGNDGGCVMSYDFGEHWTTVNGPAVGQFYSVAVDNADIPVWKYHFYNVYGGTQDNGNWSGSSAGQYPGREWNILAGIEEPVFRGVPDGDGMQVQIDTLNSIVYSGFTRGNYFRSSLVPNRDLYLSIKPRDSRARQNWETPIWLSRHNPDVLYYGSERLYRSSKRGDSLTAISGDLTRGGYKYWSNWYGTLTSIHESPIKAGLLYTGSDDGLIYRTWDTGRHWNLLTIPNIPQQLWVNRIVASRYKEGRVYVSLSGYIYDHLRPYLFVSEDYGANWKAISNELPCEPVYVLREDPKNENLLYIGTEGGLYVSMDRGTTWMAWHKGLPKGVPVRDIAIQERENEIVLATYGRSLYKAKLDEVQARAVRYGK